MKIYETTADVEIRDRRERTAKANLTNMPPLYTPKGQRPIDPRWIIVEYGMDADTDEVRSVSIRVSGWALYKVPPTKRLSVVVRRFPLAIVGRDDVFSPEMPDWVWQFVRQYWPEPR